MIESIHNRLLNWAEAVRGGASAGSVSSIWNKLISGEASSAHSGSSILISPEADEIEKAVVALPEKLRETLKEYYLNIESTLEQKLEYLGISKKTLYRRLDRAHEGVAAAIL